MFHFLLARPDQLDGIGSLLGDLNDLANNLAKSRQTATEGAAHDHRMEGDLIHADIGRFGRSLAAVQWILHAAPQFKLAVLEVGGEREGLHHRVMDEWHGIAGLDQFDAAALQAPPARRHGRFYGPACPF